MVLWFDVGLKRYTTHAKSGSYKAKLWFDVGLKRYTTHRTRMLEQRGCGLM